MASPDRAPAGTGVSPGDGPPGDARLTIGAYRAPGAVATLLRIALILWVPLAAVGAAVGLGELQLAYRLEHSPLSVSIEDLDTSDSRVLGLLIVMIAWTVVTAGFFMAWARRIYLNASYLGATDLRHSPGWATWGWIVPIANLWIPKQVIDDSWRASDPGLEPLAGNSWTTVPGPALIPAWWGTWLASGFLSNSSFNDGVASPRELQVYSALALVSIALAGIAAILAYWVVTGISRRQEARAANVFHGRGRWALAVPSLEASALHAAPTTGFLLATFLIGALIVFGSWAGFDAQSTLVAGDGGTANEAEGLLINDLAVGDCFNDPPDLSTGVLERVLAIESLPCDEPHDNEVFALMEYQPESDDYPGDSELFIEAARLCIARVPEYLGVPLEQSGLDIFTFQPLADSWALGDRGIVCALFAKTLEPLEESLRGGGGIVPDGYGDVTGLDDGTCFEDSVTAIVEVVSCASAHDNQIFATVEHSARGGAPFPGELAILAFAAEACEQAFEERVSPGHAAELDYAWFAIPSENTWLLGDRAVSCVLWDRQFAKLSGSRLKADE